MCNCIKLTNDSLKEQKPEANTQVSIDLILDFKTGHSQARVGLRVEKLDDRKRGKPISMLASFCPFCGEKYPDIA